MKFVLNLFLGGWLCDYRGLS